MTLAGCAGMKRAFGIDQSQEKAKPIENPFDLGFQEQEKKNIVVRSKNGERALEIELPSARGEMAQISIPASPDLQISEDGSGFERQPASLGEPNADSAPMAPSASDFEIESTFPGISPTLQKTQQDIEQQLGVVEDSKLPQSNSSYLQEVDRIKQNYRAQRYEAALYDVDRLIQDYPTSPQLHKMRGTLLSRMGHDALAMRSWKQALQLKPNDLALSRFLQKKEAQLNGGVR